MTYYERNREAILAKNLLKRDDILEYNKSYYQSNHKKICERSQEWTRAHKYKVVCECGRTLQRNKLNAHTNTEIHKRLIRELNRCN